METLLIYHRCAETIRGHVLCSFLALLVRYELQTRLAARGRNFEWADVIQDLQRLQQVEVEQFGQCYLLRSDLQGICGPVLRALGVAAPPTVQAVPNDQSPNATRAL